MSTNLSNWRDPEHSQWSFRNIDKIFKVDAIKKGAETSKLDDNPLNVDGFKVQLPDKPSKDLKTFLDETETDGLIVIKDRAIVYEHYGRGSQRDSIHIIMSITKSLTGLVCGVLADSGKIDVNAPVSSYVPEVKGTSYESITVRQCLDMRTGIQYDDASPRYRKAGAWQPFDADEKQEDLHEFLSDFQAPRSPEVEGLDGKYSFEYLSVNTDLMGWVLERATGKKLTELISELIWQPMGAESDAYITTDKSKNPRPAGGGCTTLRDLARVGQLVLKDGNGVVPTAWIEDMLNNGSRAAFEAGPWNRGFGKVFGSLTYRSYWLANKENESLMGLGVNGQMLCVDRKDGIVMAKMSSQGARVDMEKMGLAVLAFKEFQRLLTE